MQGGYRKRETLNPGSESRRKEGSVERWHDAGEPRVAVVEELRGFCRALLPDPEQADRLADMAVDAAQAQSDSDHGMDWEAEGLSRRLRVLARMLMSPAHAADTSPTLGDQSPSGRSWDGDRTFSAFLTSLGAHPGQALSSTQGLVNFAHSTSVTRTDEPPIVKARMATLHSMLKTGMGGRARRMSVTGGVSMAVLGSLFLWGAPLVSSNPPAGSLGTVRTASGQARRDVAARPT